MPADNDDGRLSTAEDGQRGETCGRGGRIHQHLHRRGG